MMLLSMVYNPMLQFGNRWLKYRLDGTAFKDGGTAFRFIRSDAKSETNNEQI